MFRFYAAVLLAFLTGPGSALAADYPEPKHGQWIARDFKFHTGEVLPELKLHYTTVGAPTGQPVLVLHGTTGSAASMLTPAFAGELFGPGQPLDAAKYFVIIMGALAFYSSVSEAGGVAHATHLGGLLVGYLYLKGARINLNPWAEVKYRYLKWRINRVRKKFDVYQGGRANDWDRRVH